MDRYEGWGGEGDEDAYAGDVEDTGMESRRSSRVRKPTSIMNIGPQESSRKKTSKTGKPTSKTGKPTSKTGKPTSKTEKLTSKTGKPTSTRRRVQYKLLKLKKEDGKIKAASKIKEEERLSRYHLHTPQEARRKTFKQKRFFRKMDTGETLSQYDIEMINLAKQILHIMKSDTTGKYAQKIEVLRDLYYVKFGVRYEEVIQKLIDTGKLSSDLIEVFESVDVKISHLLGKLSL